MSKEIPKREEPALSPEHQQILDWLRSVRFRRSFGGVEEADVWRKIDQLNSLYEKLLLAERARYEQRIAQLTGEAPHE